MRNFHWNVVGQDFFEMHEKFEKLYNTAIKDTDDIAERVKLFGMNPISTLRKCLEISDIKETDDNLMPYEMAKITLTDIRSLLEKIDKSIQASNDIKDSGTMYMLQAIMYNLEKTHWMFSSWIKQHV